MGSDYPVVDLIGDRHHGYVPALETSESVEKSSNAIEVPTNASVYRERGRFRLIVLCRPPMRTMSRCGILSPKRPMEERKTKQERNRMRREGIKRTGRTD